jgi:Tol biopolymer transport system component
MNTHRAPHKTSLLQSGRHFAVMITTCFFAAHAIAHEIAPGQPSPHGGTKSYGNANPHANAGGKSGYSKEQTTNVATLNDLKSSFLSKPHQITFDGTRAGEGYFSPDGKLMIFQSERETNNPFYKMYVHDFDSGKTWPVSNGVGKTTCGWISPDKKFVTYASTHLDPKAKQKQQAEIEERKNPKQKRYAWDYDENYDIFISDINSQGQQAKNLTKTLGYDAEGAISPDGKWIVFASNRTAYNTKLTDDQKAQLAKDPSFFMEIYVMDINGKNVKRITESPGYDGGPFFSADGKKITWRRFTPDGMKAEIMTANADGSDQRQITKLGAMSWAPFFHPSGDYLIFTTSAHGHQNFELYMVDAMGTQSPVRVTEYEGFDGLPVFTPDGKHVVWNHKFTSNESQLVRATWDDQAARQALKLPDAKPLASLFDSEISANDAKHLVKYLASPELKGRATGSPEELIMNQTLSKLMTDMGLKPYGAKDFFHSFEFRKESVLGKNNQLSVKQSNGTLQPAKLDTDWRPVASSLSGQVKSLPIAFVGYGLKVAAAQNQKAYDNFEDMDLKGKWALMFRYVPEEVGTDRRLFLNRYSKLENKVTTAKMMGAAGVIVVSGPQSGSNPGLIPFYKNATGAASLPVISVSNAFADQLFKAAGLSLKDEQIAFDKELKTAGFAMSGPVLDANIEIDHIKGRGTNVIGYLPANTPTATTIMIGAHGDHLGDHPTEDSLRSSDDQDTIHYGADDNASGVAATLEVAHKLSADQRAGRVRLKHNVAFAIWSGEELGLLGSQAYLANKKTKSQIKTYINMDMVGRWQLDSNGSRKPLNVQGIGSSADWRSVFESAKVEFPLSLQNDPYLPTDAMQFYLAKIPIVAFFTGVHAEYHTPRDTWEKINYEGIADVAGIVNDLTVALNKRIQLPTYQNVTRQSTENRRGFRIYLGTIPDYAGETNKGVKLAGVIEGGPAQKSGLQTGDIIVEFSGKKIDSIHDYVFMLESLTPMKTTQVVVVRNGTRKTLDITPTAKE